MNDTWNRSDYWPSPEVPKPDTFINTLLDDRYLIEKELGHGGVGAVYLARDRKLHDKPVVVKVLLEKSMRNTWVVQKFRQEKEALARLNHPGVVAILDTGELDDGKPFIVMEYVDGTSLRNLLKQQPQGMDFLQVASMVKQIGAALTAVHEKKIYHRDLKPENIMLQPLIEDEVQVKIVDFGIAKIKESVVAASTVSGGATAGTMVYMSPEQLNGDKITPASDIYSFGVIAYELVTGRRPFNPDTIVQLYDMQREGVRVKPVDLRPRLPQEAQNIILKMLAFDAQARYEKASEVGSALCDALLNEEETLKHQPKVNDRKSRSERAWAETLVSGPAPDPLAIGARRRILGFIVVGLLLLSVLAAGGYAFFSNRQSRLGNEQPKAATGSPRSLFYSLTVQKMREGKPYQDPFQSSGQEIFETGYKFRINVSSPESGYLYIFNEGADLNKNASFNIIYPTPVINNGSAQLAANQTMQTNWNTFAGQPGTEMFWIVWSVSPIQEMETARAAAFKSDEGALFDDQIVRTLKGFLIMHADPKPETTKDTAKQQTEVRRSGDVLVKLLELEHR